MADGKLIVIVAPSGTGKSTLIKRLRANFPKIVESVSYTTRPMREGEVEGVNYYYTDKETFLKLKEEDEFLEHAIVHSNYYGTSKTKVEEQLKAGKCVLFDLDVQGADFFKDYFKEKAQIIFLEPPSIEELESRLIKRATEPMEVIQERVANAKKEILKKNDYNYLVENRDLEVAYKELEQIFSKILGE